MNIRVHFPDGTTADLPPGTRAIPFGSGHLATFIRDADPIGEEDARVVLLPAERGEEFAAHHQPLRAWIGNRARVETAEGWRPCVVEGWEAYAGRLEARLGEVEAELLSEREGEHAAARARFASFDAEVEETQRAMSKVGQ